MGTEYDIKFPSSTFAVTKNSIWSTITAISKTGYVFTKEQIIEIGGATKNKDALIRILAYLKYLGILTETRENTDNKEKGNQKFQVSERKEVRDMLYELKAQRETESKKFWKEILREHDIYKLLAVEFFTDAKTKTYIDLEHFLRKYISDKGPAYIQNGGKFIVSLLSDIGLLKEDGNDITLSENDVAVVPDDVQDQFIDETNIPEDRIFTTDKQPDTDQVKDYLFMIKGPNDMNHTIRVKDKFDVELVKVILGKINSELGFKEERT